MHRTLSLLLIPLFAWPMLASAGGGGHHHDDDHMSGMRAVKESVPAQFRVMDRTPVTPTTESLARGKALFAQNCAACHGSAGKGDGPAAAALSTPPANFHDAHHSGFYNPGEKFWIISNGTETGMPAFSSPLNDQQRWDLVNHILNLPKEEMNDLFD